MHALFPMHAVSKTSLPAAEAFFTWFLLISFMQSCSHFSPKPSQLRHIGLFPLYAACSTRLVDMLSARWYCMNSPMAPSAVVSSTLQVQKWESSLQNNFSNWSRSLMHLHLMCTIPINFCRIYIYFFGKHFDDFITILFQIKIQTESTQ